MMMMAYDQSPSPSRIDDATIAAVRAALIRYVREGNHTHLLRAALRELAAEARAKSVRAEQLLILLKELWGSIAEVRHASLGSPYEKQLQALITICIDEYYAVGDVDHEH